MIYLHESMGPGRDQTRDPWICSQTCICSGYRLSYSKLILNEIKIHVDVALVQHHIEIIGRQHHNEIINHSTSHIEINVHHIKINDNSSH